MSRKALQEKYEEAYRRAVYRVLLEEEEVRLAIGVYDALAEATLQETLGIQKAWAILTPCNPRSQLAREEMNLFYMNELRSVLDHHSGAWVKAINSDPTGKWPDEPGFFVADPDPVWIQELGRRFHQNALVFGRLGEAPRLVWLD